MNLMERTMQKHSAKPKVQKKTAERRMTLDPRTLITPTKKGKLSAAKIDKIVNSMLGIGNKK